MHNKIKCEACKVDNWGARCRSPYGDIYLCFSCADAYIESRDNKKASPVPAKRILGKVFGTQEVS